MKIIVTHASPDWDAITSCWLLKKFLPGWEEAHVEFVPAGTRFKNHESRIMNQENPIETIGNDEVIHVDTGLGPLDHHQTADMQTCAASLTFDYVKKHVILIRQLAEKNLPRKEDPSSAKQVRDDKNNVMDKHEKRIQALRRIIDFVVALDHFQEVFWTDAASDRYEFGMYGILEGFKNQHPNDDSGYVVFGMILLDAMLHRMENRIWSEEELEKGIEFETRFGKGLAIETINDEVMKLGQKMGYVIIVRKDPRKGYVRIKVRPNMNDKGSMIKDKKEENIDLTLVYEQLSKMDPHATWFLHVSKKMLLNGTPKNPTMVPTTLTLQQIMDVVKKV